MLKIASIIVLCLSTFTHAGNVETDILALKDLLDKKVSTGVNIPVQQRLYPGAMTVISAEQIEKSGANTINDVIEKFVPGAQRMRHGRDLLGFRGITSDLSDQYLFLINGQKIQSALFPNDIEKELDSLKDIKRIEVLRGSGSFMYGSGGMTAVINVIIDDVISADEGLSVSVHKRFVDEIDTLELEYSRIFNSGLGLYLYGGYSEVEGAKHEDSPIVFGSTFIGKGDIQITAGQPIPQAYKPPNDKAPFLNKKPEIKLHLGLTYGDLDLWARYAYHGLNSAVTKGLYAPLNIPGAPIYDEFIPSMGSQTALEMETYNLSYHPKLTENISNDFNIMFQKAGEFYSEFWQGSEFEQTFNEPFDATRVNYGSELLSLRNTVSLKNKKDIYTLGLEYIKTNFGRDPHLYHKTEGNDLFRFLGEKFEPWTRENYSIFGEYTRELKPNWNIFFNGRFDKETYTDSSTSLSMRSVYQTHKGNLFKASVSNAFRNGPSFILRRIEIDKDKCNRELATYGVTENSYNPEMIDLTPQDRRIRDCVNLIYNENSSEDLVERLTEYELRYELHQHEHLSLASTLYFSQLTPVKYTSLSYRQSSEEEILGLELEGRYIKEKFDITFSHSFSKLISYEHKLNELIYQAPFRSPEAFGEGKYLTNWSHNLSKITTQYALNDRLTLNGDLQIYWDHKGDEIIAQARNNYEGNVDASSPTTFWNVSDEGYKKAFRTSQYLNLGLQYKINEKINVRLDALNILGWVDKDLNKRNYFVRGSDYRSEHAAVGLSITAKGF